MRHAGQYYDAEVNIFYNYFRDYDPITGRYIESDPIGLNGGLNTYGYVGGNVLHLVDPTGLNPLAGCALGSWAGPVGCGAGAAIGGAAALGIGLYCEFAKCSITPSPANISDNAPTVEWPKKRLGKYVCNCRAQGTNCEGERAYGFGVGVDSNFSKALSIAKKMAVSNVPAGFDNIHHTSCKCIGPKGERIIPHKG